jgi:hypothetical protein
MTGHLFKILTEYLYSIQTFTVGSGIAPDQLLPARGLSPPVGNFTLPPKDFVCSKYKYVTMYSKYVRSQDLSRKY